jgi:DNA polymerase III subunit beta
MLVFSADRENLANAISRASQGLAGNPPQPVYAGMLFTGGNGEIRITASDGDMTFSAYCAAESEFGGNALIPGKMISEISRYFTGKTVSVDYRENGIAEITAGRAKFTLSAVDGVKYPAWQNPPAMIGTLDAEEFAGAVRKVAPAASRIHPVRRGICLAPDDERLCIVATDGPRMAVAELGWDGTARSPAIVPVPVMERFARAAADEDYVQLGWNAKMIGFGTTGLQVTSRLLSGVFPDWKKVMAASPQDWVTFDPAELSRIVKMAQLAADEGRIELSFCGQNDLHVTASQQGRTFSDYMDTDYDGDEITILMGADILLNGLSGCKGDGKIAFTDPRSPVYLRSGSFTYTCQPRQDMKEEAI